MTDKKTQNKKTTQKHQCADNCVRHGDCGCEKFPYTCNNKKIKYCEGGILPVSQRVLRHILTGDKEHFEDIMEILENTSQELLMGYRYLEILSKEMSPFPKEDIKLIKILKKMEEDLNNNMTHCQDVISDYIILMEDVEDMINDGEISKDIAERYLDEEPEDDDDDDHAED
jgi:bacterioferritin (cytochrome b1)